MNRFRKHKKAKEVKDALGDLEGNSPNSSPFSLKPSKKKDAPESTPQLDFTAALPPTDDFRTSLLMPKLSARFSMLREQDDPESKMGKASDDSVLFPKRASRLNLFGHNPNMLTDIDEVSSNDGSCRPSIALGRTDSYASGDPGYGTDDDPSQNGSIMSRARRADGNNLFGGRQKVYRIPIRPGAAPSPTSPSAASPGGGMGKAVYDHDLNLSAFQKMRRKEKEDRIASGETARDSTSHEFEDANSTNSSANRTTYSSTASGPIANPRTSTAATSIEEGQLGSSQPQAYSGVPESSQEGRPPSAMSTPRNGSVRTRRLYGQGLTQAAQNQQNSTLHRLESLSRQRAGTPDSLSLNRNYSRSATNLRDRLQKLAIAEPPAAPQPNSPPSSATSPKQATIPESQPKEHISPTSATFGNAPPLSPPSSETDDGASLLAAALNPEDHGKATAMGLFNRPATGFDEQAFSRRQMQMHQGRATPPPQRSSSPRPAPQHEPAGRSRGLSKSSYRSRAESASSHYSSDAHNGMDQSRDASPSRPGARTFYANSTASESGDDGDDRHSHEVSSATSLATEYGQSLYHSNTTPKPPTPNGEHLETLPEVRYPDLGDLKPIEENEVPEATTPVVENDNVPQRPDSPVLQADFGLKGISSHLRQESDKSSIFPPPSPGLQQHEMGIQQEAVPEAPLPSVDTKLEEEATPVSQEQPEPSSPRASSRNSSDVTANRSSEDSCNNETFENNPSWKEELAYHHRRDGSTETQKEREEFAIELAERRKKVQEKLRCVAEGESRPSSPTTTGRSTPDLTQPKAGNAFSILKHKSSKQGIPKPDQKSLYGYNSSSTPALVEESWRHEERPSHFNRNAASSPHVPTERSFRSRMPTISRNSHEDSRESSRSRGPSPSPGFRSQRDRSGSEGSGRSKSRTRYRDRDDLQTVEEGSVIAHENFVMPDNFEPPVIPASTPGSRRPSMEFNEPVIYDRSASAASGRYRSTSRSGTPSFQYERPFQFSQASHPPSLIGATPRPSPATPAYSANATPPLNDTPEQSSTNLAAPASASVSNGHAIPQRAPGHAMLQKRAVNKKLISEPTFVSSTSNVPTVGLPPGGLPQPNAAPPLPPMNPRRRRGTQTILGAFRSDKHDSSRAASPAPSFNEERSSFVDDERRPPSRNRLRKTSSAGGSLSARARQEAMASPAPAVPQYPPPAVPVDGGMF